MPITANASLNFLKYPSSEKVIVGRNVCNNLNIAAQHFPNLPLTTQILLGTTDALAIAEMNAQNGEKSAIKKQQSAVKLWNKQFKMTANYVSLVAEGNVQLITDAGFNPTKTTRQKAAKITTIDGFAAIVAQPKGTATAQCNTIKSARGFIYISAPESVNITMKGDDLVIDVNGVQVSVKAATQSRVTLTGLASGQKVCISMFAFNTAGSSALTEEQSVIPQ